LIIGWVIIRSNLGEDFTEFLNIDSDSTENVFSWLSDAKKATIFLDQDQVDYEFKLLTTRSDGKIIDIVPVEIYY